MRPRNFGLGLTPYYAFLTRTPTVSTRRPYRTIQRRIRTKILLSVVDLLTSVVPRPID